MNTRRQGWLSGSCWSATPCLRILFHLVKNRSHGVNCLSSCFWMRQFWAVSYKVLQMVPGGMKPQSPTVELSLDFLCSLIPHLGPRCFLGSSTKKLPALKSLALKHRLRQWQRSRLGDISLGTLDSSAHALSHHALLVLGSGLRRITNMCLPFLYTVSQEISAEKHQFLPLYLEEQGCC